MEFKSNAKITPGIVLIVLYLLVIGCGSDDHAPDVSHLQGTFELVRTDLQLFALDTNGSDATATAVFAQHPAFWDLYFHRIMPVPGDSVVDWRMITTDPFLRAVADSVRQAYPDLGQAQLSLEEGFQYLQYYFPGNRVPRIYTLISGFGFFPFIFDDGDRDGVGVSLEMFLGSDFPYKTFAGNEPVFSEYLTRTYHQDFLAKRTLDVVIDDLSGPPRGDRLLDQMIHHGVHLYILRHLMPSAPDTVIFEFTPAQLQWCQDNERALWAHLLTEDLLYSSELRRVQKLIAPAPSVPGMPPEAPGGVANWTGWRIVSALMARKPELTMLDLLAMEDAQTLLEEAKYRPK